MFKVTAGKARLMRSGRQGKQLSILVTLACLLGLAGCGGFGSVLGGATGCSSNCTTTPPEFLYATSPNHILAFSVDSTTGALGTPVVFPGPNQSTGLAASANGAYLYVSDFLNNGVDGLSINTTSGGLTSITGSPFDLGGTPPGAGGLSKFFGGFPYLYATDLNAAAVNGFLYDSASGALTPVPGSPFSAGDTPVQAVQAGGLFLYVSNLNDPAGGISAFTVNAQNGALSTIPGSPFPTGPPGSFPGPSALVVSGGNNLLYVALAGTANANNQIAAFAINPTTGTLTTVPGSPFTTGNDPLQIAYVPVTLNAQAFLYTANVQDGTISAFTADNGTGVLTPVKGSPYVAGTSIGGLAASSTATAAGNYFLYASDPEGKTVGVFTIDGNTGALASIPGSPFAAGKAPMLLTIATP